MLAHGHLLAVVAGHCPRLSFERAVLRARQGVMLTHGNLLAVVAGQLLGMDKLGDVIMQAGVPQRFTTNDVMISYLPLAHIFDRRALVQGFQTELCILVNER